MHTGIDFGAQKAGTTAICYNYRGKLYSKQSVKGYSADDFIEDVISTHQPSHIFLDAPLSLPGAYYNMGDNFFYRRADIELEAMSPMFLGGLTARAMKLKSMVERRQIPCIEVYPKAIAQRLLSGVYHEYKPKKSITSIENALSNILPFPLNFSCDNWHQIDSVLAWLAGYRFLHSKHITFGSEQEGLIIV
ncbi:MAG: hypothetical protein GVY19_04480 [Bacteroidetes bacterium]|jgi:predicted nuclease with RNAse H fold|nr:hypothetical protein [Bacteroidota bacterium]